MTSAGTVGAALLLAGAAWLAVPTSAEVRTRRLLDDGAGLDPVPALRRLRHLVSRRAVGPAARRRRSEERMRVVRALAALAAELEAGQPARRALALAAGAPPVWPHALAALRLEGDVPEALEADARDSPVLAHLAACWRVAADAGAGLAAAVSRLAESARSAEDARADLEGQLAGPRATARLLALLPLVGIGMGLLLGSDPLGWLLGSPLGRLCLGAGLLLTAAGTWWTGRIAASVERLL